MKNKRLVFGLAGFLVLLVFAFGCAPVSQRVTKEPIAASSATKIEQTLRLTETVDGMAQYEIEWNFSADLVKAIDSDYSKLVTYLVELSQYVPEFQLVSYVYGTAGDFTFVGSIGAPSVNPTTVATQSENVFFKTYNVRYPNPVRHYAEQKRSTAASELRGSTDPICQLMGITALGQGSFLSFSSYFRISSEIEYETYFEIAKKMAMTSKEGNLVGSNFRWAENEFDVAYTIMRLNSITWYALIAAFGVLLAVVLLLIGKNSRAQPALVDKTEREKRRIMIKRTGGRQPTPGAPPPALKQIAKDAAYDEIFGEQRAAGSPSATQAPEEKNEDSSSENK